MRPAGLSQEVLASALGISRRRVNELVRGRRGITPDTAIRLALYFGTDAAFWIGLQTAWDMHVAWRAFRRGQLVSNFPESGFADKRVFGHGRSCHGSFAPTP